MIEKVVEGKTVYQEGIVLTLLKDVGVAKEERRKWKEYHASPHGSGFKLLIQKENPGQDDNNLISIIGVTDKSNNPTVFCLPEGEFKVHGFFDEAVKNTPAFLASLHCKMGTPEFRDACISLPVKKDEGKSPLMKANPLYDDVSPPDWYEGLIDEEEDAERDETEDYDEDHEEEDEEDN